MAKRFPEPGMNDSMAEADRKGWEISTDMVTGKGEMKAVNDGAGMEVGNPYDTDPMGEDYGAVTYPASEPDYDGKGMGPSATQPRTTTAGNTVASAPQNRTAYRGSSSED